MEKALLVAIKLDSEKANWQLADTIEELEELTITSGAQIADRVSCLRDKPTPNLFIGKGKAEEIALLCQEEEIDTVIFSHDLSGTQQRNLEEVIGRKTIDRTQLILDIFARHARSPEGKMQVELAQLQYLMPRLVGKGIILSRLGGGIGTSGPGEQKLEVDRRRIRKRIDNLRVEIRHYFLHRKTIQKRRKENVLPTVALVGYTNAGKSTLLNALTHANQPVADSLFTTLDTLYRGLQLPNGENIIISDTVGFLYNLPHHLIEAFKATLEEVVDADLLIHVLDVSHHRAQEHCQAVLKVLRELNAQDKPLITALNKIDLLEDKTWLTATANSFINPVPVSAKFAQNLDSLLKMVQNNFAGRMSAVELLIPHSHMGLIDLFYRQGRVEKITYQQRAIKVKASLPKPLIAKLLHNKEVEKL